MIGTQPDAANAGLACARMTPIVCIVAEPPGNVSDDRTKFLR